MSFPALLRCMLTVQLLLLGLGLWGMWRATNRDSLMLAAVVVLGCGVLVMLAMQLRRQASQLKKLHEQSDQAGSHVQIDPGHQELATLLAANQHELQVCKLERARLDAIIWAMGDINQISSEVLRAREAREKIESTLLTVAEREQERLGRELHDGVGQELAGAAFLAKALAARLESSDSPLTADAEWIKQVLLKSIESVRTLSRQLSPTELERGELLASLDRLCNDVERAYGIHCSLRVEPRARELLARINAHAARQFYRVTQESLNNATRHGACQRIRVRLDVRGTILRLAIADDGSGIPPELLQLELASIGGLGLQSMRLRANSLCGHIRFTRRLGATLILMRIPVAALTQSISEPAAASSEAAG